MKSIRIRIRSGMTLLEILIAVAVFSIGMLPVLSLVVSTNKGAYSMSRHMFAGQLAASITDRLLALSFDECREKLKSEKNFHKIIELPEIAKALQKDSAGTSDPKFSDDMHRLFRNFEYDVVMQEPSSKEESGQYFLFMVTVYWQSEESNPQSEKQKFSLSSMKFREY